MVPPRDSRVRPTADRVREAWMSILGDDLNGAEVLDLFAGSGALGLEALSRGAGSATFVELNPPSLKALEQNIAALGVDGVVTVHRGDAIRFVERLPKRAYHIVFADPPYADASALSSTAEVLGRPGLLLPTSVVVFEHAADVQPPSRRGQASRQRRFDCE